jgi:hypothetical protein
MKPSLRADLTSILAIGAGAFVSGLLTAFLFASTSTRDGAFLVEPHVRVEWEAQVRMAGPEGEHSGWFPEGEEHVTAGTPGHVRLESSEQRIVIHRKP